jgi:dTDP-4-dehydrorhamnose 3,5-epimerase
MAISLIATRRYQDERGWFSETYSARHLAMIGIEAVFVQDNQSFSARAGTLRGLHFQGPPAAQAKLVRCIRGHIFDVAVDLRRGSPTYGRWVGAELSAETGEQIFVPPGFAHGFVTLDPETEVAYKTSAPYSPEREGGLRWDDPEVGIAWPVEKDAVTCSDKDRNLPSLSSFETPFDYDGVPLELSIRSLS